MHCQQHSSCPSFLFYCMSDIDLTYAFSPILEAHRLHKRQLRELCNTSILCPENDLACMALSKEIDQVYLQEAI